MLLAGRGGREIWLFIDSIAAIGFGPILLNQKQTRKGGNEKKRIKKLSHFLLVAHLCCLSSLVITSQSTHIKRGVARTWAIMFYAASVISVEVLHWSQNNYHIPCHWTSARAQQSFQMASKQHCSSQSFIRYKVQLCYCLTRAKTEKKKQKRAAANNEARPTYLCTMQCNSYCKKTVDIYIHLHIFTYIPVWLFQIAYEKWNSSWV